jgi:hypothetical protein
MVLDTVIAYYSVIILFCYLKVITLVYGHCIKSMNGYHLYSFDGRHTVLISYSKAEYFPGISVYTEIE